MLEDKKYSYQNFTFKSFKNTPAEELSNIVIKGSSFHQREPWTGIFPTGVENLELLNCNVDNVDVPAGVTLTGTSCNRNAIYVAGEGRWTVDRQGNKLELIEPEEVIDEGGE